MDFYDRSELEELLEHMGRVDEPGFDRRRFLTILGSKLPSRSLGVRISTGPCSVESVLGIDPLRVFPAPPGGSR